MNCKKIILIIFVAASLTVSAMAQARTGWKVSVSDINRDLFDNAVRCVKKGKLEKAEEKLQKLLKRRPLHFYAHYCLSGLYSMMENYEKSAQSYEKMLYTFEQPIKKLVSSNKGSGYHSHLYNNLGFAYYKLKRFKAAEQAFKEVLKNQKAYRKLKSSDHRKFYPDSSLKAKPFFAQVHYRLGLTYLSAGDKASAKDQCQKIKELGDNEKAEQLSAKISQI